MSNRLMKYFVEHNEIFVEAMKTHQTWLQQLEPSIQGTRPDRQATLRDEREAWNEFRKGKTGDAFQAAVDSTIQRLFGEGWSDLEICWVLWEGPAKDFHAGNEWKDALHNYVVQITGPLSGAID